MIRYVIIGLTVIAVVLGFSTQHYRNDAIQSKARVDEVERANSTLQTSLDVMTARVEMLRIAGDQRDKTVSKSEKKANETIRNVPVTRWSNEPVDTDVLRSIRVSE